MKTSGFTLIELLIILLILSILAVTALPGFKQAVQNTKTQTAKNELLAAIEHARARAIFSGSRSVLKAKDKWHNGWQIFLDKNNDGIAGEDESILLEHDSLDGVIVKTDSKVKNLISFISTGEGKLPGKANAGGFIAGTITICPVESGKGYKLILSKAGRTRTQETEAADCP